MSPRRRGPAECRACAGMFGPLREHADIERGAHATCAKMTEDDWRALAPWLRGDLGGIQASGA